MLRLLPVCLFVVPFGIAFGVAAAEQGLTPFQATVMSGLVFTATAQFASLEFLNGPVSYLSLALVVLALSARHIVMGAALSSWVNVLPFNQRLATLALLSDANFADARPRLQEHQTDVGEILGGGVVLWLAWTISTAVGAFGGERLGDTTAYGLGSIMLCFFAATAVQTVRASSGLVPPVAIAAIVSVATLPILPTGWNIILAALVGGAIAVLTNDQ